MVSKKGQGLSLGFVIVAALGLIVLVETLHKIHKTKERLKTLEERVEKIN